MTPAEMVSKLEQVLSTLDEVDTIVDNANDLNSSISDLQGTATDLASQASDLSSEVDNLTEIDTDSVDVAELQEQVKEVLSFLKSLDNQNGNKRITIFSRSDEDGERQIITTSIKSYETIGFRIEKSN
jgi:hypothetical protein